jgi:hypothetical protein
MVQVGYHTGRKYRRDSSQASLDWLWLRQSGRPREVHTGGRELFGGQLVKTLTLPLDAPFGRRFCI